MSNGIIEQLKGLEREIVRLDELLADDPNWQVYHQHISASPGRPEVEVEREISLPPAVAEALAGNRLFQARRKLVDAVGMLEELLAKPGAYPNSRAALEARQEESPAVEPAQEVAEKPANESHSQSEAEAIQPQTVVPTGGDAFRTKLNVKATPSVTKERPVDLDSGPPSPVRMPPPVEASTPAKRRPLLPFVALEEGGQPKRFRGERSRQHQKSAEAGAGSTMTDRGSKALEPIAANDDQPDDLRLIFGITSADLAVLNDAGIRGFEQIANLTAAEVKALRGRLVEDRRISTQQWIEQAAILSAGQSTHFARSLAGSIGDQTAPVVERPEPQAWEPNLLAAAPIAPATATFLASTRAGQTAEQTVTFAPSEAATEQTATSVNAEPHEDVTTEVPSPAEKTDAAPSGAHDTAGVPGAPRDVPETDMRAASSEADLDPIEQVVRAAERQQAALNERIDRLNQTISTIVMPDLRRPPPAFPDQSEKPVVEVGEPAAVDIETTMAPPAELPPEPEEKPIEPVLLPELPPVSEAAPLSETPTIAPEESFDEADVKIVHLERPAMEDVTFGLSVDGEPRTEPVRAPVDEPPDIPASHSLDLGDTWSPRDLARRMERVAIEDEDEEDIDAVASRFVSEVEEASVQIVRQPRAPEEDAGGEVTPAPKVARSSAPNPKSEAEHLEIKPPLSSSRFLGALTGRQGKN